MGMEGPVNDRVYGSNPVRELLRSSSRTLQELAILGEGRGPRLQELLTLARQKGVKVSFRTREQLTAIAGSPHHQGVVARVAEASYLELEDLLPLPAARGQAAFFLALDQVQDPRNLGALLRIAEGAGAHGVIVPKHHAAGLTPAAARASMGAVEFIPVAREANLVSALERLKKEGVWVIGATPSGGVPPWEVDLGRPLCLVLGGEHAGLRPLVASTCDHLVSLPMKGKVRSLNVAAAGAIFCYEVVRQREKRS